MRNDVEQPIVLHRDADLLVLNKPAWLPTTATDDRDTLVSHAKRIMAGHAFVHPTSRLDNPVSGVVIFALNKATNQWLRDVRTQGTYHRRYLALAAAVPYVQEGQWRWPLEIDPRNPRLRRVAQPACGKRSATHYRVVCAHPLIALIEMRPLTGRTHQIRVHAAAAQTPLLGDREYGGLHRVVLASGRVATPRRVMLHCFQVQLPQGRAQPRTYEAPVPDDFVHLWQAVTGEAFPELSQSPGC